MNFLFIPGRAREVLEVAENPVEMWIVALYTIKKKLDVGTYFPLSNRNKP